MLHIPQYIFSVAKLRFISPRFFFPGKSESPIGGSGHEAMETFVRVLLLQKDLGQPLIASTQRYEVPFAACVRVCVCVCGHVCKSECECKRSGLLAILLLLVLSEDQPAKQGQVRPGHSCPVLYGAVSEIQDPVQLPQTRLRGLGLAWPDPLGGKEAASQEGEAGQPMEWRGL